MCGTRTPTEPENSCSNQRRSEQDRKNSLRIICLIFNLVHDGCPTPGKGGQLLPCVQHLVFPEYSRSDKEKGQELQYEPKSVQPGVCGIDRGRAGEYAEVPGVGWVRSVPAAEEDHLPGRAVVGHRRVGALRRGVGRRGLVPGAAVPGPGVSKA